MITTLMENCNATREFCTHARQFVPSSHDNYTVLNYQNLQTITFFLS